jgi:hypothetical protein
MRIKLKDLLSGYDWAVTCKNAECGKSIIDSPYTLQALLRFRYPTRVLCPSCGLGYVYTNPDFHVIHRIEAE